MKTRLLVVAVVGLTTSVRSMAQWAVFDAANLQQSITNYATLIEQLAKQAEQISNQVQQIRHMEDQLERMGRMADVKEIVGFPELRVQLTLPTKLRSWTESLATVDGGGVFSDSRGGVFAPIGAEFPSFDGTIVLRDADTYKPTQVITANVDQFREVQADVYVRREELRAGIVRTSEALQAAETEAEEQKLQAVLKAQYDQLATLDAEVLLSAAEVQVRATEAEAMDDARTRAEAEQRMALAQEEAKKVGAAFKPTYDSILRYVKEEPYRP